jgi:hypothetical protein
MNKLWLSSIATLGAAVAAPVAACSICRCGDPTFNALGHEGIAQTGLRLALDWDTTAKSQGADDEWSESRETRTTLLVAYGFSDRYNVYVRVPYSDRDLTEREDW